MHGPPWPGERVVITTRDGNLLLMAEPQSGRGCLAPAARLLAVQARVLLDQDMDAGAMALLTLITALATALLSLVTAAGVLLVNAKVDRLSHSSRQFSRSSPLTRPNSRRLSVTSTSPSARAWAAISMSLGPIGRPRRSRSMRTLP